MKKLISTLLPLILILSAKAQFADHYQAFDPTLKISMGCRKQQNGSVEIAAGLTGRRLPISVLVGANLHEFDTRAFSKTDSSKYLNTTGYNATVMIRLVNLTWRDVDVNIYETVFKNTDYVYETGIKAGIMLNGRNRMYLNVAKLKNSYYSSMKVGVSFSLFFWNGYSAY